MKFLKRFSHEPAKIFLSLYFLLWFAYFASFWMNALTIDAAGNLVAGHVNMWGDWAAHFTMGSSLGYRELFLTSSPFLVGAPFAYPFAANGVSAILIRLGFSFMASFVLPSFVFSCLIVVALFFFYKTIFKSQAIAIIASLIFLLNGGVGFWYFGQDVINSPEPLETLMNPPHEYTRLDTEHIKWISVIDSMIIPQRAFTMGFPLTLLALALIHGAYIKDEDDEKKSHFSLQKILQSAAIPALLLGLMPFVHTHSFLAAGIVLAFWSVSHILSAALSRKWTLTKHLALTWGVVAVLTSLIALPLLKLFFFGQVSGFIQWYPGWLAKEFEMNWVLFWFKNWGLTPLIGLMGWITLAIEKKKIIPESLSNSQLFKTFAPFFVIFLLANLFLFQPFAWDNTKLIVWASVGISGMVGYFIVGLWREQSTRLIQLFTRSIAVILFAIIIASGTIDAYWIQRTDLHHFAMYSQEELQLAEWVKSNTPVEAIWLTGDQHNHWLFNLTGRQAVMTYRGWLWTHGYKYLPVEADVSYMFLHPDRPELFQKYNVRYIVIGPNEIKTFNANPTFFELNHKLLQQTPNYRIFEVMTGE